MASTINASTSAGIIQTADTSGVLALQTGGTTALTINTTGSVAFGTSASAYGTSGQVLTSAGDAAPSWGAVNLSTQVSGTLPVGNGGTGATTLTANNVLLGNGTAAPQFVAPGTAGNVLTSNGTTWTSAAASGFPAGTAMMFVQTSAPTGWTKSTTHDNKALRVVSGTASSGGSVAFTTAFASQGVSGVVGDTTLSTAQMPTHSHTVNDSGHAHQIMSFTNIGINPSFNTFTKSVTQSVSLGATSGTGNNGTSSQTTGISIANNGSSSSHNHSFTGTAINLAVQYVDVIIATKN
jgi:hypothetical protein